MAAKGLLVLVEPGTPAGYGRILRARDRLVGLGATLAAPCPHHAACPLTGEDWCHFSVRLPRSRDHRLAKGGEVPGFKPSHSFVTHDLKKWVHYYGYKGKEAEEAELRYSEAGWSGAGSQSLKGPAGTKDEGVVTVVQLGSPAAARKYATYELRQDVGPRNTHHDTVKRFKVPGVPGSLGFEFFKPGKPGGGANVLFTEGSARMLCKIFYAEQFDALRRKCGMADRIIESLSRCLKWDSKGGKTKSVFLKTLDDRLVMKSLSPIETWTSSRARPSALATVIATTV